MLQRAGGWPMVSHLVSFGSGGLGPPTDTWRTALSSWIRQWAPLCTSTCEISHMVMGGESPQSRGGGIFTFSARVWIFKGKRNRHFCRACYKARSAFCKSGIEEAPIAEAGEKSDSICWGWECPPGSFKRFLSLFTLPTIISQDFPQQDSGQHSTCMLF